MNLLDFKLRLFLFLQTLLENFEIFKLDRQACGEVLDYLLKTSASQQPFIQQLFTTVLQKHGCKDTSLWLQYISWVRRNNRDAGQLYWKALKTLDSSLAEEFNTKYTLSQLVH